MELKEQITQWLQPELNKMNLFMVEVRTAGKGKIEVFVDGDTGVTINQCAELSRFLEGLLDGTAWVSDHYTLDVSSPGMDNPLRVPRQYRRRIGRTLDIIRTDGSQLVAQLLLATDEHITVQPELPAAKKAKKTKEVTPVIVAPEISLQYGEIKKATVQIKWK
jgi:ribosome maturation factor RimP